MSHVPKLFFTSFPGEGNTPPAAGRKAATRATRKGSHADIQPKGRRGAGGAGRAAGRGAVTWDRPGIHRGREGLRRGRGDRAMKAEG